MDPLLRAAIATLILAGPAAAQPVVAPQDFERMSEGRTMTFTLFGQPFGAEQFFAGRRSLWQYADGECEEGKWHAKGDAICFVYPSSPAPHCWHFRGSGDAFTAHLLENGVETGFVIDLESIHDRPLACAGPRVGS
jgi:hypothetical protein